MYMRVEEIALRSEIRQMLNEAGYNKNSLKDLVKQVLSEELRKAINQAIAEQDLTGYIKCNVDSLIKKTTKDVLKERISDRVISMWLHRLDVQVDVKSSAEFNEMGS